MTVTLSERCAAKVVADGPKEAPTRRPRNWPAGKELMEPMCADVTPPVLRWSPSSGLPLTGIPLTSDRLTFTRVGQ